MQIATVETPKLSHTQPRARWAMANTAHEGGRIHHTTGVPAYVTTIMPRFHPLSGISVRGPTLLKLQELGYVLCVSHGMSSHRAPRGHRTYWHCDSTWVVTEAGEARAARVRVGGEATP